MALLSKAQLILILEVIPDNANIEIDYNSSNMQGGTIEFTWWLPE